ncbi:MAG: hypothetical protein ABI690_00260 [Chloroflexota bacterium]
MAHIVGKRFYPQTVHTIPRPRLSPLLRMVVIMSVGFTAVTVGSRAFGRHLPAPVSPFSAYADIFPGQPASALDTQSFDCHSNHDFYHDPTEQTCTFVPTADAFLNVQVRVSEGLIQELTFMLRENALQVGDLERFLGTTAIRIDDRKIYFTLPKHYAFAKTVAYPGLFSLFLPAWSVTFTSLP